MSDPNSSDHLAQLLAPAVRLGALAMPKAGNIDAVIAVLQGHLKSGSAGHVPEDLQFETVQRFWNTRQLPTLKDARLVAYGLNLRVGPEGECILDDDACFSASLAGLDGWLHDPRWYRRCYQGLVWSYFNVDIDAVGVPEATRHRWERLRTHLAQRAPKIIDPAVNPDWVKTVVTHRHLFGDDPCEHFVAKLLSGDRTELDLVCTRLGISGNSWFLQRLVQAQVDAAVGLEHEAFSALLPTLIEMLATTSTRVRDTSLAALLERYAQLPQRPAHATLRDALARAWGLPWHPSSNVLRWSALTELARGMATEWLKADLIDRFFAEPHGALDSRRAAFWKRFTHSMQQIERAPDGSALVMTMGRIELREPADLVSPLLGHYLHRPPGAALDLQLPHEDGLRGWRRWEQMFEDALKDQFELRPGVVSAASATSFVDLADPVELLASTSAADAQRWHTPSAREDVHWQTAEAAIVPYSRPDLEVLARVHALHIDDETARTGKLWVRADDNDQRIAQVLRRWGFEQVRGQGWVKGPTRP